MIVLKCLFQCLTVALSVSLSPPPWVYATTVNVGGISASVCFANRFVWQSNAVDTISSSGSPPGIWYLVWCTLLACRHGFKVLFDDCQSPHHLDTHIIATTGKYLAYDTSQQLLWVKQGIKIHESVVVFGPERLFSHFSNRHSWFWLRLNSEYFEIFVKATSY